MPEMPGNPDRFSGLDDRMQSVTDGNTHTQPEVTVADDQQPSTNRTDLDRVNEELGKHEPNSSAYNALKERQSELSEEQPPTSDADIRSKYGNSPSSSEIPTSSEVAPVEESPDSYRGPASGDDPFANLRGKYGNNPTPSETSGSLPGDSTEISGGGDGGGGDGGGGGGDI